MIDLEKYIEQGLKEERQIGDLDKKIEELEKIKAAAEAEIDKLKEQRRSGSFYVPQWQCDLIREVRAMIEARKEAE